MALNNTPPSTLLIAQLIICSFCLKMVWATTDNITSTKSLKDPETIVSKNGMFKLGFFSPVNSSKDRYVGIWYNIKESDTLEVVWVANKNNPIKDSSGVLHIAEDSNLQLFSKTQNKIFWSSNYVFDHIDVPSPNNTSAVLNDVGSLDLISSSANGTMTFYDWRLGSSLTNTLLPETSLSAYGFNDGNPTLMSWKSTFNPSNGSFILRLIPTPLSEIVIEYANTNKLYWRSGPWNGNQFNGIPGFSSAAGNGFRLNNDENRGWLDLSFLVSNGDLLTHIVLNYDGNFIQKNWDSGSKKWLTVWQSMVSDCDTYGKCGPFGNCNAKKSPICSCLNGFEPKNKAKWSKGDWTHGCVRKTQLRKCGDKGGKEDGFLRLQNRKLSDKAEWLVVRGDDDCRIKCLQNCSCIAYANPKGIGCMLWSNKRSLIDIQQFSSDGADLFIRLAHSELDKSKKWKKIIAAMVTMMTTATLVMICIFGRRWSRRRNEKNYTKKEKQWIQIRSDDKIDQIQFQDLQLFNFENLEVATNNFSIENKLGRGGFGTVYKGKLDNGQQIAVKRLARYSGQGIREFMNEVDVISKLQHKNLVSLLGCCVEGEEKLLVYEYLPNKSLDAFLFESVQGKQLNWKRRLNIIKGICRGLLYLHRDSRLKIIHRDLKPSNILLDEDFNPKISDFGMAKIFCTTQDEANTSRVVGTYGYMSPEYAMEGCFSEKSDVYSFGVLLLEIVSGKRNKIFLHHECFSLLTHAWTLWNQNEVISFVDATILEPEFEVEILKCIQLGLLCVQERPEDRPSIPLLIKTLDTDEVTDLPCPKQPGFTQRKACSTDSHEQCSRNQISITVVSGR